VAAPRVLPLTGLIAAETLSLLGNQFAVVAIPLLVLEFTHSAVTAGIAGSANLLPILFAALLGGRAIDRFGAWRIGVLADVLSGISVLALPVAFLLCDRVSTSVVFALVLLGALFDPTCIAARQTLVPLYARLARRPLDEINSVRGALESGADLAGPLLAGGLIALFGAVAALFANAASFLLCVAIFVVSVPRPRRASKPHNSPRLAGLRYVMQQRTLRALALTGVMVSAVVLPFLGLLLPVLATEVFRQPPLFGVALAAFGFSAMLGAGAFSALSRRLSHSAIFYGGIALCGGAIALCCAVVAPWMVVGCAVLGGGLLGAGNPLEQTLLQRLAPRALAGQIFTALGAIRYGAAPLTIVAAGLATEWIGVRPVLLGAGVLLAVSALAAWRTAPLPESQ
jgi:macrolide resistance protein